MDANTTLNRSSEIPEPNVTRFLFADRRMARFGSSCEFTWVTCGWQLA